MNTILKSEKAELKREKKKETQQSKRDKLRNQHKNSKKNKKVLSDPEEEKSESLSAKSVKSKKLKKNFGEDYDSNLEFGALNQYISESSLIDFGMLSDTFKEENQVKIREK